MPYRTVGTYTGYPVAEAAMRYTSACTVHNGNSPTWGQHTSRTSHVHIAIPFPGHLSNSVYALTQAHASNSASNSAKKLATSTSGSTEPMKGPHPQTWYHDWGGAPYAPRGSLDLECMQGSLERGGLRRRNGGGGEAIVISSSAGALGSSYLSHGTEWANAEQTDQMLIIH